MPSQEYEDYLQSPEWRDKRRKWLKRSGYRCAMFPWVEVGTRGNPADTHHMHYRTFKRERFGRDVVMLCPFAHRKIIHGFLSGGRIPQQQDSFPNAAQRAVHFWCRLPRLGQWLVLGIAAIGIVDWQFNTSFLADGSQQIAELMAIL